jgi:hypothetical protein
MRIYAAEKSGGRVLPDVALQDRAPARMRVTELGDVVDMARDADERPAQGGFLVCVNR